MDGSVILWAADGQVLRTFRKDVAAAGVLAMQVTQSNLLYTATEYGLIDIWDMSGACIKSITTRSIENMPIRCMAVTTLEGCHYPNPNKSSF
jgi:WD40 repeat protein